MTRALLGRTRAEQRRYSQPSCNAEDSFKTHGRVSLHSSPGLALTNHRHAALQVERIGAFKRNDPVVSLAVVGVEKASLPLIVAGLGRTVQDDRSDFLRPRGVLDAYDLAAKLAAAIVEKDPSAGRRPHKGAKRLGSQRGGESEDRG